MTALAPSLEIARRAREAECRYTLSRLQTMERLPGNPSRVAHKMAGGAYVMCCRIPTPEYNRITGLADEQVDEIPDLLAWFAAHDAQPSFEVTPDLDTPRVIAAIAKAGFIPTRFQAVTFGPPAALEELPPRVAVDVVTAETFDAFLESYARGWGFTPTGRLKDSARDWLSEPNWTLYLGRVDGAPAGAAILYMDGATGYLAEAAVDPGARGRRLHTHFLNRRMADAGARGADLICAVATQSYSTSHRNMIRAGLQTLHTKAVWTKPVSAPA